PLLEEDSENRLSPRKVGDRRGANWNLFSKNSRIITSSSVIWPLPILLSVTRPLHWLAQKATATNPLEKDVLDGSGALEILARVSAQAGEPDRAIPAIQKRPLVARP